MTSDSQVVARNARRSVVRMTAAAKAAHTGSSLSVIDMLSVLYVDCLDSNLNTRPNDLVLVSKGHAAAGVYAVLAHAGFFPIELLETYCKDGSALGGHVTRNPALGISFSTGSLGHALPFGVGRALASRRQEIDSKIYVVLSDGECDEGSNWEAALLASHLQLDNLVVLIDRNGLQSLGSTESTVRLEPLAEKWQAFGWSVLRVDGHDHNALKDALGEGDVSSSKPMVVICDTVKGFGVSFMENSVLWHYKSPNGEDLDLAISELGPFE